MSYLERIWNDIPLEEVPIFVNVLKKELPQSLFVINFIETCHKWKRKNNQLQISLLYTERSMETGIFIGILKSGCQGALVSLYAFDNYDNKLENALKYVSLDWNTVLYFECVANKHQPIVEKLINDRGLKIKMANPIVLLSMPIEEALKIDVQCPDDVFFAPLTEHHVYEIYKIWRLNDIFTIEALKNAILYNSDSSLGIFCKKTGNLLTNCVRSHSGSVQALQTVKNAQSKGYAKLLLRYEAKKMAEKNKLPYSYVRKTNLISIKVHISSGYKETNEYCNFRMNKQA